MTIQSRRRFLTNAVLAGATSVGEFSTWGKALAAEPPPEITTLRFEKDPVTLHRAASFSGIAAGRGFYRYPLRGPDRSPYTQSRCCQLGFRWRYDRPWRGGFRQELCAISRLRRAGRLVQTFITLPETGSF
jgi:hypothetical protein